jgi:hypothetical protein
LERGHVATLPLLDATALRLVLCVVSPRVEATLGFGTSPLRGENEPSTDSTKQLLTTNHALLTTDFFCTISSRMYCFNQYTIYARLSFSAMFLRMSGGTNVD